MVVILVLPPSLFCNGFPLKFLLGFCIDYWSSFGEGSEFEMMTGEVVRTTNNHGFTI